MDYLTPYLKSNHFRRCVDNLCPDGTPSSVRAEVVNQLMAAAIQWQTMYEQYPTVPQGNLEVFMLLAADVLRDNPGCQLTTHPAFQSLLTEFTATARARMPQPEREF